MATAGAPLTANAFSIAPAALASDRLGRNWLPPARIAPCRRMTGMMTASERQAAGSRRSKKRFTAAGFATRSAPSMLALKPPAQWPKRRSAPEKRGTAVARCFRLRRIAAFPFVQVKRWREREPGARAAHGADDDAARRLAGARMHRQDRGRAEAAVERGEDVAQRLRP